MAVARLRRKHALIRSCGNTLELTALELRTRNQLCLDFINLKKACNYNMPFPGLLTSSTKSAGRSEYGRVKVVLPRGRSLMDWIRLASGKILAKKRMSVDHIELVKHNRREDCWIHIFGQVYDVTSYLEFHPGGIPELMRAAGTDATELFNHYHAWINYESMLKSCHVGRFTGDLSLLPQPGPSTINPSPSISTQVNSSVTKGEHTEEDCGVSVITDEESVTLCSENWGACNLWLGNILVDLSASNKQFRIVVRAKERPVFEVKWYDIPMDLLSIPYEVAVKDASIIVIFESSVKSLLSRSSQSVGQSPLLTYYKCVIEDKRPVSHNTVLFTLRLPAGLFFPVAPGRHVSVKVQKGESVLYRPYTPVSPGSLSEEQGSGCCNSSTTISFMIKIYKDGTCTPCLEKLGIGDSIEISEPIGNVDLSMWTNPECDLLLLAAGTGITPMVNALIFRLRKIKMNPLLSCSTRLLLFNRTEQDIISDDWLPMRWDDNTIKVEHILSDPSEGWVGRTGHIEADMIPLAKNSLRILVCGPDGFIENAAKILHVCGYKPDNVHIFKG